MAGVGGEQLPGGQRNTLASDQTKRDLDALQRKLRRELSEAVAAEVEARLTLLLSRYTFSKSIHAPGIVSTWGSMPSAETELFGLTIHRVRVDLSLIRSARLNARVTTAGATGSKLFPMYSIDNGGSWNNLFASATLPLDGSDNVATSGWSNLQAGAKADDVLIRVTGRSGDGVVSPAFGDIDIEFSTVAVP